MVLVRASYRLQYTAVLPSVLYESTLVSLATAVAERTYAHADSKRPGKRAAVNSKLKIRAELRRRELRLLRIGDLRQSKCTENREREKTRWRSTIGSHVPRSRVRAADGGPAPRAGGDSDREINEKRADEHQCNMPCVQKATSLRCTHALHAVSGPHGLITFRVFSFLSAFASIVSV